MATSLQELGRIIVQDNLGDLCAEVFAALATNGRADRHRLSSLTGIPDSRMKSTLACMLQLHILLYRANDAGQSTYQIDWRNTYSLIRSSRIYCLVEDRYGESAGKIVAYLLRLGHARVRDLVDAFGMQSDASGSGEHMAKATNGNHSEKSKDVKDRISTTGQLHIMLRKLIHAGFLVKMGSQAYIPYADLQAEVEEIVISEHFPDRKIGGPKKQAEFANAVNALKRKRRDQEEFSDDRDVQSSGGLNPAAKRAKLNRGGIMGMGNGVEMAAPRLADDLILRVNYAQCVSALRSDCLRNLAEQYMGIATADVYEALLRVVESKSRARDDHVPPPREDSDDEQDDQPIVSTVEIADLLDPAVHLNTFVSTNSSMKQTNGSAKHKKRKTQTVEDAEDYALLGIKQESSDSENEHGMNGHHPQRDRGTRLDLIEEHLKLLDEHPLEFCKRVGPAARGEWRVDFSALTDALIQRNIDATIMSRLGPIHMRVVRMLREKGRIDEKQIASASMMRLKDVRSILTQLQYAGFVESQDVPKDTQRQPSRTIFLYFYDQKRVQEQLLHRTYKSLSRMLQRLQLERERYASAIEKAERMDANQESLNQNEREAVMQWRAVEERILLQVERLDGQVALLRDFTGRNSSLIS